MSTEVDLLLDAPLAIDANEVRKICSFVLEQEGVSRDCMVSVSAVDEERMHELNLQWRQQNKPTDVLSLECERPDDPELAPFEPCELGDIVLAPTYIARQAAEFGTTPANETRLLLVHGMLHLLGYDHVQEDEAQVMEAREDELLALMGAASGLGDVKLTRHAEEQS